MATLPADQQVRVGLVLTHQYRPDADLAAAVAEQRETLRFVRDRGWDSVVVGQHYLAESLVTLQPLPLLAHAAADLAGSADQPARGLPRARPPAAVADPAALEPEPVR